MPEFDPVQVDRIPKPFEVMQYLYAIQKESTDPKDKTLNQHDRRDPAASCAVYLIRS